MSKEHSRKRASQTFHPNYQPLRHYGGRTGQYYENRNQKQRNSGYGRWSDYISDDTDQLMIPREQDSTFSEIKRQSQQPITIIDNVDSNEGQIIDKEQQSSNKEQLKKLDQHRQQDKQQRQSLQDNKKNRVIRNEKKKEHSSLQPFAIAGVSTIKERKSIGNRRSEEYLLDLLKSANTRKEEELTQQQNKKKKEKQEQKRFQKQKEIRKRQSQKQELKKRKDQIKNELGNKINQRFASKQLKTISEKAEESKTSKSKRVTINDRGKIKLPTDSFSVEFDPLLPSSLRKGLDSSYHKRLQPGTASDQEEEFQQPAEPMAIIEVQQDREQSKAQSQREQNPQKNLKKFKKNEKKSKAIRTTDDPTSIQGQVVKPEPQRKVTKGRQKSRKRADSSSRQTRKQKESKEKKIVVSPTYHPKNNKRTTPVEKMEKQRKKVRKGDENVIIVENLTQEIDSGRPTRTRSQPLKFWLNQKPKYNLKHQRMDLHSISSAQFLKMVGFDKTERIQAQQIRYNSCEFCYKIQIKPNQHFYSTGIRYRQMEGHLISPEEYDLIALRLAQQHHYTKNSILQITINDFQIKNLGRQTEILIQKDETFQIKNTNAKRSLSFNLSLIKSCLQKQP